VEIQNQRNDHHCLRGCNIPKVVVPVLYWAV